MAGDTSAQQHDTLRSPGRKPMANGNTLSQLQQSQVRTLREGFQILDRDSDGVVNREDVADMLAQLGMRCSRVKGDRRQRLTSIRRTSVQPIGHIDIFPTVGAANHDHGAVHEFACNIVGRLVAELRASVCILSIR